MDDDVHAGPMRTPIWTLNTITSTFGTTLEMLKEVTLLHPNAQCWLGETSNTQKACVGSAMINNVSVESYPLVVCVMKR